MTTEPAAVSSGPADGLYVSGGNASGVYKCGMDIITEHDRYTADDTWIMRAPLVCPWRQMHGAVALGYGYDKEGIFTFGGNVGSNVYLDDADRYRPDYWVVRATNPAVTNPARGRAAVFSWNQGAKEYGIQSGGERDHPTQAGLQLTVIDQDKYDPTTDTWAADRYAPSARKNCAAWSIGGLGYMHGGQDSSGNAQYDLYRYLATAVWQARASSPAPLRYNHRAFVLDDKAYVCGGEGIVASSALEDLDRYDPATDTWQSFDDMPPGVRIQVGSQWITPTGRREHIAGSLAAYGSRGAAGYLYTGKNSIGATPNQGHGYNTVTSWFAVTEMAMPDRYLAAAETL